MKSLRTIAALVAVLGMGSFVQAGLFGLGACGASKCCDCAPTFQPTCCKPTITRPCHRNVFNYQRSCAKATGCDSCGGPSNSCCPTGAGNCAGTGTTSCAGSCGNGCATAPACAAPCGNGCATTPACAAPCGNGCAATTCAAPCGNGCAATCAAPCGAGNSCSNSDSNCCASGDGCCATTCQDACQIAQLIYESQTACYAKHRRAALQRLGRKYDCVCNPEIMSAFIYGLNDSDERVRATAADKIGDELRKNKCCCSQCTVEALTIALADCDRVVRRQAEQALRQCGYDIVDPCCCEVACCDSGCVGTGCSSGATGVPAAVPAYSPEAAPATAPAVAPAPPAEPKAYFPKRISDEHARPVSAMKKSLKNLFGLAR